MLLHRLYGTLVSRVDSTMTMVTKCGSLRLHERDELMTQTNIPISASSPDAAGHSEMTTIRRTCEMTDDHGCDERKSTRTRWRQASLSDPPWTVRQRSVWTSVPGNERDARVMAAVVAPTYHHRDPPSDRFQTNSTALLHYGVLALHIESTSEHRMLAYSMARCRVMLTNLTERRQGKKQTQVVLSHSITALFSM